MSHSMAASVHATVEVTDASSITSSHSSSINPSIVSVVSASESSATGSSTLATLSDKPKARKLGLLQYCTETFEDCRTNHRRAEHTIVKQIEHFREPDTGYGFLLANIQEATSEEYMLRLERSTPKRSEHQDGTIVTIIIPPPATAKDSTSGSTPEPSGDGHAHLYPPRTDFSSVSGSSSPAHSRSRSISKAVSGILRKFAKSDSKARSLQVVELTGHKDQTLKQLCILMTIVADITLEMSPAELSHFFCKVVMQSAINGFFGDSHILSRAQSPSSINVSDASGSPRASSSLSVSPADGVTLTAPDGTSSSRRPSFTRRLSIRFRSSSRSSDHREGDTEGGPSPRRSAEIQKPIDTDAIRIAESLVHVAKALEHTQNRHLFATDPHWAEMDDKFTIHFLHHLVKPYVASPSEIIKGSRSSATAAADESNVVKVPVDIQSYAASALASIAAASTTGFVEVVDTSFLPTLLNLLDSSSHRVSRPSTPTPFTDSRSSSPSLELMSTDFLSTHIQPAFYKLVHTSIENLKKHENDIDVNACLALKYLSSDNEKDQKKKGQNVVIDAGGIEAIVVQLHPQLLVEKRTQMTAFELGALDALWNLTRNNEKGEHKALAAQGDLVGYLVRVLNELTTSSPAPTAGQKAKSDDATKDLLQRDHYQALIVDVLRDLSRSSAGARAVMQSGALQILLGFLNHPHIPTPPTSTPTSPSTAAATTALKFEHRNRRSLQWNAASTIAVLAEHAKGDQQAALRVVALKPLLQIAANEKTQRDTLYRVLTALWRIFDVEQDAISEALDVRVGNEDVIDILARLLKVEGLDWEPRYAAVGAMNCILESHKAFEAEEARKLHVGPSLVQLLRVASPASSDERHHVKERILEELVSALHTFVTRPAGAKVALENGAIQVLIHALQYWPNTALNAKAEAVKTLSVILDYPGYSTDEASLALRKEAKEVLLKLSTHADEVRASATAALKKMK